MESEGLATGLVQKTLWLEPEAKHPDDKYSGVNFSALYVGPDPEGKDAKSVPVVLWPHGGPHSVITTE